MLALRAALILFALVAVAHATIYGGISPQDYLLGQYVPSTSSQFSTISSFGLVNGTNQTLYIRNEAGSALANLLADFTGLTGISVPVYDATRTYFQQLQLWESKFFDNFAPLTCNNTLERCLNLLQYTSMPGAARHHWGTEVDLFSAEQRNTDFDSGNGSIWYNWMVANASAYGFYEPYNNGRCAGYFEQKWHWSYAPLAVQMLYDWNNLFGNDVCPFVSLVNFTGALACGFVAPVYAKTINPSLMPAWTAPNPTWSVESVIVVFVLIAAFTIVTVLFLVLLIRRPVPDPKAGYSAVPDAPAIQ